MRRRTLVILTGLVVLGSSAGLAALAMRQTGAGPVYTVSQVTWGLAHKPAAWVGRTIQVRGRLSVLINHGTVTCCSGLLVDPSAPAQHIRLVWRAVSPVLTVLLRIPVVNGFVARGIGDDNIYHVRIVRVTYRAPEPDLPGYYPYTKRTVVVRDDSAIVVGALP